MAIRLESLPKGIGLKSNIRHSAGAGEITLDYVTRRFNAISAGLKNPWGWTFAGTPPNAIGPERYLPVALLSCSGLQSKKIYREKKEPRYVSSDSFHGWKSRVPFSQQVSNAAD